VTSESAKPAVGFIGLGKMGVPMASRLLGAGYPVTVWNRTAQKMRELVTQGANPAALPSEAVSKVQVAILMLADGPSVSQVLFERGLADALRPGSIVVDMSSISPLLAGEHAAELAKRSVHHLDAPVSGGVKGAAEGSLAIMVGGEAGDFEAVQPILTKLERPTLVGPSGCGQLVKLANQAIVASTICAVAEALLLVSAASADPVKVREALLGGFADSAILKIHGGRMLEREWTPGGLLRTQVKDLRTLMDVAGRLGLNLPASSKVAELFESGMNAGFGDHDHSALLLELERINCGRRVGNAVDQVQSAAR
jgi:2-hydroxy-3-oxopropionate reductase